MQYQGILLAVNLGILLGAYLLLKGKPDKLKLIFITTIVAYILAGILPYLLNWISSKWIVLFYAIAIAVALIVIDFIITDNVIEGLENDKIDIIAAESGSSNISTVNNSEEVHTSKSSDFATYMTINETSKLTPRTGGRHLNTSHNKPGSVYAHKPELLEKEETRSSIYRTGSVINLPDTEKIEEKKAVVGDKIIRESIASNYRRNSKVISRSVNNNELEEQPLPALIEAAPPDVEATTSAVSASGIESEPVPVREAKSDTKVIHAEEISSENIPAVTEEITSEADDLVPEDIKKSENPLIEAAASQDEIAADQEAVADIEKSEPTLEAEPASAIQEESTEALDDDALELLDIDELIDIAFQAKFRDDYRSAIRIFELVLTRKPAPQIASLIVEDLEIMQSKIA